MLCTGAQADPTATKRGEGGGEAPTARTSNRYRFCDVRALILGGTRADRLRIAAEREETLHPRLAARVRLNASTLAFVRPSPTHLPVAQPRLLQIDDIELAFPNSQVGGTRLVLTQSTYLLQKWIDSIDPSDCIIATADHDGLRQGAPEALERRGPWRHFEIINSDAGTRPPAFGRRELEEIGRASCRERV